MAETKVAAEKTSKMQVPPNRLKKRNVIEALRSSAGIQSLAAAKLRVSPQTIGRYIKKHPDVRLAIDDIIDEVVDLAQGKLIERIRKGDMTAIRYYLDNKGQAQGYGVRKLAFRDNDGQMVVPAVLITSGRMTPEEWDTKYGTVSEAAPS